MILRAGLPLVLACMLFLATGCGDDENATKTPVENTPPANTEQPAGNGNGNGNGNGTYQEPDPSATLNNQNTGQQPGAQTNQQPQGQQPQDQPQNQQPQGQQPQDQQPQGQQDQNVPTPEEDPDVEEAPESGQTPE